MRLSIITPNFNGAAFIEETLKSVADQNYPNLEYIVVDGASTDDSVRIIEKCRSGISTFISEPDCGHADAVNKGFEASTGEVMGWINSDDVLLPGALDFVERLFSARPDIEWITGRSSSMDEEGRIGWIGPLRPWSRLRFLSGDHKWIQQESTFWRRSLWERVGGGLELRYSVANDFDLWRRFFRYAELHTVDRHLGCFRIRSGQRSIKFKALYEAEMAAIHAEELEGVGADYSGVFDELLPASARQLKPVSVLSGDPRYAIGDPPIIRSGEVLGWCGGEFQNPPRRAAPMPIGRAIASSDLTKFKGIHQGERCFIMGNGPSLNQMELSKLAGEIVFACNAVFLLFDKIAWRPTYYACVDSRVLPDRATEIDAMLKADSALQGFFPTVLLEHSGKKRRRATRMVLPPAHNRHYFTEQPNSTDDLPHSMFSYDVDEVVIQPYTVAITMMQLAAYMGFTQLILIGCDTNYVVPETVKRGDHKHGGGIELTSAKDDDPNHFDPRYFGRNKKWHDPQPEMMIRHHQYAKDALDAIGVEVYNATVGGRLEVFPRRRFEEFFPLRSESPMTPDQPGSPAPESENRSTRKRSLSGAVSPIAQSIAEFIAIAQRSRGTVFAAAAIVVGAVFVAVMLRGSPLAGYVVGIAGFLILLALLAIVTIKLRGFIVALSRQVLDIASGASMPQDDAVRDRLKMENELTRLREEVERIKQQLANEKGKD